MPSLFRVSLGLLTAFSTVLLTAQQISNSHLVGGDKKKARALAEELRAIDPSQGYLADAQIAQFEKDFNAQESALVKALHSNPKRYATYVALAFFYADDARRRFDMVEKYANEALKIDSSRTGAYSALAISQSAQQKWSELESTLSRVDKDAPDDLSPYSQAARILVLDNRKLLDAERYLKKYLTQEPEGGSPNLAVARWRLGIVLEKQGRKPEAISEIETAVRMNPDLQEAKKDLKRLK